MSTDRPASLIPLLLAPASLSSACVTAGRYDAGEIERAALVQERTRPVEIELEPSITEVPPFTPAGGGGGDEMKKVLARAMSTQNPIRALGQTAPLTAAEEARLTTEYARTRDGALGRKIAQANLRLVIKLAARYSRVSPVSLADLIQDGTVGLMEAVARFEPRRGVRFASYATWWIRAYLLKSLIDNARVVRAGRSRQDRRAFFQGTAPPREVPLDVPLADGPDAEPVGRSLADGRVAPVDQRLEMLELASVLRARARAFQQRLRPREAAVFAERVLSDEETPRHRLARRFSVSKERIRQIEKDLVGRFRLEAEAA